jgi:NAD(P)-dependent dehydrogenase (short-subunit alcohol dehydrogenase family)
MDLGIANLRVLVTAGAAGIGRGIVEAFVEEGARVFTCDVDGEGLKTLPAGVGHRVTDVADRAAVADLVEAAVAELGGLDVLVNNAGIAGPTGRVDEIHPEDWDRTLEVCLTSGFNLTRLAVPHLRQSRNASIVNLSSVAGKYGFALRTPYAAAKWGVIGFTKSLAIELGDAGIRVNAILPVARHEAKAQQKGISYAEMEATAFSFTSIKDYVTASQIADQILFLCSPRGRTISGQAIAIDGDTRMLS